MRKWNFNFRRPKFKPWAGSSTFPTSVDNKTALTDGIDYIEADNVNNAYVPINTIETFIGASGASQANNVDILAFLDAIRPTVRLSYTSATTVTASAGLILCKNSGGTVRVLRKNTSTTAITFSNIDTGAEASSTIYYVWAIADATATTVTFKISTSSSAPSGSTYYALVGSFYNNSSSDIDQGTVASIAGERLLQKQRYETGAMIDCANATPYAGDNTSPTNAKGDQVMTYGFLPVSTTSKVRITVECNGCFEATNQGFFWLLLDADTSARKTGSMCGIPNVLFTTGRMTYEYSPGAIARIVAYVRASQPSAGYHFTFNGIAAAAKCNSTLLSSIQFEEFEGD